MNTQSKGPLYRSHVILKGRDVYGAPHEIEAYAEADARNGVKQGASFASIQCDSQGSDHPDNAGKFFLHRYVKA